MGARGSVVGWGTMLKALRSRVRVPMRWIFFFKWPNPSSCTMALESTQPLTEISTRNLPGGKEQKRQRERLYYNTCYNITGFIICLLSLYAPNILLWQLQSCQNSATAVETLYPTTEIFLTEMTWCYIQIGETFNSSCIRPAVPVKQHHEHTSPPPPCRSDSQ
jgi:hypothetical protein